MTFMVWVPAVPLPYLGWIKRCGTCNKRFFKMSKYTHHWIHKHAMDAALADGPHTDCSMSLKQAMAMGYGPVINAQRLTRQV